ncbi:MAG: hypothetical protein JSV65_07190 [Armatimonadota bacterium]|nr:MAG: hypothetical protein JSV65_07190 [Armatimonadota bacterium]
MPQSEASASDTEPPDVSREAEVDVAHGEALASLGYVNCIQYCLEQRGDPRPKALLMGVSGEGFRLCFDRNDPERGLDVVFHNPLRAVCAALGYDCEVVYNRDLKEAGGALLKGLATRGCAILRARPDWVVVQRHPSEPDSLLARLPDGQLETWSRSQLEQVWVKEPGLLELGLPGYYHFVLGDKERKPDEREAAMASLRRAVRMLMRKSRIDGCAAGLAAYSELLDSLLHKQRTELQQARILRKYAAWNARPLPYIRDSRRAAAQYLRMIHPHFDEETTEHLDKAADSYSLAARVLAEVPAVSDTLSPDHGDGKLPRADRKAVRGFAYLRRKAARRVRRARQAEEEALLEIRRALEAAERKDNE